MQPGRARGQAAVGHPQREILQEERVAQRGLDAHVAGHAGEDQGAHVALAQQRVEIRRVEAAVARLADHEILRFGLELIHQGVIPGALDHQLALELGPPAHQAERVGLVPVGRALAARVALIRGPAHLEEDDGHPGLARGDEHLARARDHRRRSRDVDAEEIEIASLGGEGVLHVDHEHGGARRLDRQRLGARGNRQRPAHTQNLRGGSEAGRQRPGPLSDGICRRKSIGPG